MSNKNNNKVFVISPGSDVGGLFPKAYGKMFWVHEDHRGTAIADAIGALSRWGNHTKISSTGNDRWLGYEMSDDASETRALALLAAFGFQQDTRRCANIRVVLAG